MRFWPRYGTPSPKARGDSMNAPTGTADSITELARLINVWRENGLEPVRPAVLRYWARHTAARTSKPPAPELAIPLLRKLRLAFVDLDGALAPATPLQPAGSCSALDRLDPPLNRVILERMLELPLFAESIDAALASAEVNGGVVVISFRDLSPAALENPSCLWLQHRR